MSTRSIPGHRLTPFRRRGSMRSHDPRQRAGQGHRRLAWRAEPAVTGGSSRRPVSGPAGQDTEFRERDRRLAARMLRGEEAAFDEFFHGQFPRLYRFALTRLGNDTAAAEDVVQAALCRAVRKLHTYRGEATLFAWLCTLCRHEISDHFARSGRYVRMDVVEETGEVRSLLDSLAAAEVDHPETAARRAEVSRLVHGVLDALPQHYASALEWKYVLGLSVVEIADRLGVGPKAAESVLSRARQAFREAVAALAGGTAGRGGGLPWD